MQVPKTYSKGWKENQRKEIKKSFDDQLGNPLNTLDKLGIKSPTELVPFDTIDVGDDEHSDYVQIPQSEIINNSK